MSHILFGIDFEQKTYDEVTRWIALRLKNNESTSIATPNPEMLMEIRNNKEFQKSLEDMDLRVADGIGVLWASKYLTLPNRFKGRWRKLWAIWQMIYSCFAIIFYPPFLQKFIPERVSGSDLFWGMIKICNEQGKRPFFLGAAPGVAEIVREKVVAAYPNIQVAGVYSGVPDQEFDEEIRHYIESSKTDVVFVAYGAPKQEFWIQRNISKFEDNKIMIGVGGTFDFVAKKKKRAPRFMRKLGLEWFFRLIVEPFRYMRIYTATVHFISHVIKTKLKKD